MMVIVPAALVASGPSFVQLHSPIAESKDFSDGPIAQPIIRIDESNTNVLTRLNMLVPPVLPDSLVNTILRFDLKDMLNVRSC